MDPATLHTLHSILHVTNTMSYSHLQTQLSTCLLRSFPIYQHTSPLLLVTTLLVLSLHVALTDIHTYRHSSPLVSFAPSLSTNTLHHCCYPPHMQTCLALPHHTAYILVSVLLALVEWFFTLKMGHARKFGAFHLYLILQVFFWK